MKHAAIVIPGLDRIGGAERQVLLLATGLRRRGWRVSVIALTGSGGSAAAELASEDIAFTSLHMRKGVADPSGWLRFYRWVHEEKPDVVHAHLPHPTWLVRWSRLALSGLAIVDTLHSSSTGSRWRHLGYRLSNWLAGSVTAVSEAVAEAHRSSGLVPAHKLSVIPNGIDMQTFQPCSKTRRSIRRALGLGDEFLWVAAGRLEAVKDYPTLLRAIRLLPGTTLLLIAGAGTLLEPLRVLASELNLGDRVRFLGFVPDVKNYLQAADAAVLSSRWEGLPMNLLEAGACALPVVATDVPGSHEVVQHESTGLLATAADPVALAEAMRRLMQKPRAERSAMGARARQLVEERYSLEAVLDQWEQLYAECLVALPRISRLPQPGSIQSSQPQ
jgi:glycosyltransferase involved in cell wall biosynthesis